MAYALPVQKFYHFSYIVAVNVGAAHKFWNTVYLHYEA